MRESIDVKVLATASLVETDDKLTATYTATLTNEGTLDADDVGVTFKLPEQLHFESVSDSRCRQSGVGPFVGGGVVCSGLTLAGAGDASGRDVEIIDIVTRIVNAADLQDDVVVTVTAPGDSNESNNQHSAGVSPTFRSGTPEETIQAMAALNTYFDYETSPNLLDMQCDVYMNDIFARLQTIRTTAPEVFENLSYGKLTSGDYYWAPIENRFTRAGHVGVVVYLKGTDYHETGIVVHGTPTWSPSDRDESTQLGTMAAGEHRTFNITREGTADHGLYYRTPIANFPGNPKQEQPLGCGFEGANSANQNEFTGTVPNACAVQSLTCPAFPNAVIVQPESPVEVLITNSRGQEVETSEGMILHQELDSGIHSFATPHDDGTFGWVLVLPVDDYDVQLRGTGTGPYRLTLTTFNADGSSNEEVIEGQTVPGQVDNYTVEAHAGGSGTPPPTDPPIDNPTPTPTPTPPSSGGRSGGGALNLPFLLALIPVRSTPFTCDCA